MMRSRRGDSKLDGQQLLQVYFERHATDLASRAGMMWCVGKEVSEVRGW